MVVVPIHLDVIHGTTIKFVYYERTIAEVSDWARKRLMVLQAYVSERLSKINPGLRQKLLWSNSLVLLLVGHKRD